MPKVVSPTVVDSNPDSRVVNAQPKGIGRVTALDDFVAINNLGRNIEFSRWGNGKLEPFAVFQDTVFPEDDEPSQFDLDMHAITWTPGKEHVFAVNHYGLIRLFKLLPNMDLKPEHQLLWPGDVERFAFAGGRLASTSPQGYSVKDPAQPGVLLSVPWADCLKKGERIEFDVLWPSWGITTALAADDAALAFAAGTRLGIAEMSEFARLEMEMDLPFIVKWIQFVNGGEKIVVAGFSRSGHDAGENDWHSLTGGGFGLVDLRRQALVALGEFDVDLAWGNGGVPLTLSEDGRTIFGVDKRGKLYAWDIHKENQKARVVFAGAGKELGMAHLDRLGSRLYCGFNRDGYRMRVYPLEGSRT